MSHSPFDRSDFHQVDNHGQQTRVVYLTGPGRRSGWITRILGGLAAIALIAVIASFAVVFAAIFAAALLLIIIVATVRHLWLTLTGKSTGSAADSGVKFSGRIVVTSTGPVIRKTASATSPTTVIDVAASEPSRLLTDKN